MGNICSQWPLPLWPVISHATFCTNANSEYYGVGIRKPEALNESEALRMLYEVSEKRAVQCRDNEQDLDTKSYTVFV